MSGSVPESSLHRLLDTVPDIVTEVGPDYRYRFMNRVSLDNFGFELEDVVGRTVAEVFGETVFEEEIRPRLDRALAGEQVDYARWFDFPKTGRRWIKVCYLPVRDADGSVSGVCVRCIDETDLVRSERQRERLTRKMETIKEINRLVGRARTPEDLAANSCRIIGEDPGCHRVALVLVDDGGGFRSAALAGFGGMADSFSEWIRVEFPTPCIQKVMTTSEVVCVNHKDLDCHECPLYKSEDSQEAYLVRLAHDRRVFGYLMAFPSAEIDSRSVSDCLEEVGGDLSFALHTLHLEGEREETMAALEEARDAAEAANRAKSRFLSMMGHEIRTPLNGVIGISDYLRQLEWDSDIEESLKVLTHSGEILLELINDILDYSRIEAGRMEIKPGPVNLPEQMNPLGQMLRRRAKIKGQVFSTEIAVAGTLYELDWPRVRQVLLNLVGNALKFTPHRGQIRLLVGNRPGDRLWFAVEDSGIGIADEDQQLLFEPFKQVDQSIAGRSQGSGLGLSICKSLVERMGGQIELESAPGKGSTFSFSVPAPALDGKSEPPDDPDETGPTNPWTGQYLIAEVNENDRFVLRRQLEAGTSARLQEVTTVSGLEMLLRLENWDLVFLCLSLEKCDMREWLRLLRSGGVDGVNPDLRVVAYTAYVSPETREACAGAGFSGFLAKPVDRSSLEKVLRDTLG
jgi:PAS domain S-box-containing protein